MKPPRPGKTQIELANRHSELSLQLALVKRVLRQLLEEENAAGSISVAVVGDSEITELNERYLGRKQPTDVLAFPYENRENYIEGEVVVNADQAAREAAERRHSTEDELILYVVHGALHLLGYRECKEKERQMMRQRQHDLLRAFGREVDF